MLVRWHHLRRSLSALHRLSFAILLLFIFICAKTLTTSSHPWFCVPVTTFHRLSSPEEVKDVGRMFRQTVDPVMWVDLWEIYGAPSFKAYRETPLRREWDHVGALDEQTRTVEGIKSAMECLGLCAKHRGIVWRRPGRSARVYAIWVLGCWLVRADDISTCSK